MVMDKKGYISEIMSGGRIVAAGQITNLSLPFKISRQTPFSIYVRPKAGTEITSVDILLSLKLYQHEEGDYVSLPVLLYDWSPLCITEITINEDILSKFDIYWGAGSYVTKP